MAVSNGRWPASGGARRGRLAAGSASGSGCMRSSPCGSGGGGGAPKVMGWVGRPGVGSTSGRTSTEPLLSAVVVKQPAPISLRGRRPSAGLCPADHVGLVVATMPRWSVGVSLAEHEDLPCRRAGVEKSTRWSGPW